MTDKERAELRGFIEGVIYSFTTVPEAEKAVNLIMDKIDGRWRRMKKIVGCTLKDPDAVLYQAQAMSEDKGILAEDEVLQVKESMGKFINAEYMTTESHKLLYRGMSLGIIGILPATSRHSVLYIVSFGLFQDKTVLGILPEEAVRICTDSID